MDLVCDISGHRNWGVPGKLWVELKVISAGVYDRDVKAAEKKLVKTIRDECELDEHLGGVLLLTA